jgi:hypothetical protein
MGPAWSPSVETGTALPASQQVEFSWEYDETRRVLLSYPDVRIDLHRRPLLSASAATPVASSPLPERLGRLAGR